MSSVVLWNRTDCCGDRLIDYWVFVSNTPFGPNDTPQTLQSRAGTWGIYQTMQPNPSATITVPGAQGRYVRIQLNNLNYLSLAEVQVFGAGGAPGAPAPAPGPGPTPGVPGPAPSAPGQTSNLALSKTAMQSSTFVPGTTDASKAGKARQVYLHPIDAGGIQGNRGRNQGVRRVENRMGQEKVAGSRSPRLKITMRK